MKLNKTISREKMWAIAGLFLMLFIGLIMGIFIMGGLYNDNVHIFLSLFLISFSGACLISMVINSDAKEKKMEKEIEVLAKKEEIMTHLLQQQKDLVHHQKLESIGMLTVGIAHEFNNLLSPIMADSLLVLEKLSPDDTEMYDNILEIYNSSQKAKDLVSKISRLSRTNPNEEKHKMLTIKNLLEGVFSMTSAITPKFVEVEKDYQATQYIFGNEENLGYMFLNLVVNAYQAMGDGPGTLYIKTRDEGDMVIVTVADTGPGIPSDKLDTIFEPFFTTKEAGRGTGLGLAIARRTAENHGGTITAGNREEGGAIFTVSLKATKPEE